VAFVVFVIFRTFVTDGYLADLEGWSRLSGSGEQSARSTDPTGGPADQPGEPAMPVRRARRSDPAGQDGGGWAPTTFTPVPAESLSEVLEGLRRLS